MRAASWGSPGAVKSCGDVKIHVAPRSTCASIHCISLCGSRICTLWTMCDESGPDVPFEYFLGIGEFCLSKRTLGFVEI